MEVGGSELRLWKVSRMDMGAYMCIAKNGVPPAVSKRIQLGIDCKFFLKIIVFLDLVYDTTSSNFAYVFMLILGKGKVNKES